MTEELVFFFPHELAKAKLDFVVAADAQDKAASVHLNGVESEEPLIVKPVVVEGGKGTLSLGFLLEQVLGKMASDWNSPYLVKGPAYAPPAPPVKPLHERLSAKGKLGINFGKDKLTITVALNGGGGGAGTVGGGAAVGGGASGGQGAAVTVNVKQYSINPVFEVGALLKSEHTILVAVRFMLRYFFHWCDALNLAVDYGKKLPATKSAGDALSGFLGMNWWMGVFSIFSMKDALYDIVADEVDWIAEILQKIGIEAKFDVNAAGNFDVEVGADVNATMSARAFVPLSVVLAPLIQFLMAGSTAKKPTGGDLADKIVPFLEGIVEERVCVSVGSMPVGLVVEAKGTLAKCTFSVPKGSPLRAKIEKIGDEVFKAADAYKNTKLATIPDETKVLRLLIDLLDHELANIVTLIKQGAKAKDGDLSGAGEAADALSAGVATATPYVQQILDALQGKTTEEPAGVSPDAQRVVDMLARTKIHGIPLGVRPVLEAEENEGRKRLVIHVDDAEKAKIQGDGFEPEAMDPVLESTTLELTLPVPPVVIAWNHVSKNERLANDYAGLMGGFDDTGKRDACKVASRGRGWVPDELGQYQDQHPDASEGVHWAWIATGVSKALSLRQPPLVMPEVELIEGGKLRLTFDELPIGAVPDGITGDVPLFQGAAITRVKIWKVVLFDAATGDEVAAIQEAVDDNQPTDDPYETLLDAWLDQANGGGAADAAGETDARFDRLGG